MSIEQQVATTYGRFTLDARADAKMLAHLTKAEYPQQAVLDLVSTLHAKSVVDVGAHVGTVAAPLAKQGVQVIAFEPHPQSFRFLERNAVLNGVTIDARNKGLANEAGRAGVVAVEASNAGAHSLGAGDGVEVSMLDMEVPYADFIKIDVEGMELEVLMGGSALIARSHPAVYFEVNLSALRAHGTRLAALTKFFTQNTYKLYFLENQRLYRVPGITYVTLLIAPRSLLFRSASAPFDLLALHRTVALPYPGQGVIGTTVYLIARYIRLQYARFFH